MFGLSLKKTIVISFLAAVIIPVVISGVYALFFASNIMKKEIIAKNQALCQILVTNINNFKTQSLDSLADAANMLDSQLVALSDFEILMNSLRQRNPQFLKIQLSNHNGLLTHICPHETQYLNMDMSAQPYFQEVSRTGKPFWSDALVSPQIKLPVVSLSIPCRYGILTAFIARPETEVLTSGINLASNGFITISDRSATFILHSDHNQVLSRGHDPIHPTTDSPLLGKARSLFVTSNGKRYICNLRFIPDNGWMAAVYQPAAEVFAPIATLSIILVGGFLAAIILGIIASLRQIGHIISPLQDLVKNTKHISSGNYNIKIGDSRFPEINELASHFNHMVSSIHKREKAILDNENRLRTTLNSIADAVVATDAKLAVTHLNPVAEKLLAIQSVDAMNKDLLQILPPEQLPADNPYPHLSQMLQLHIDNPFQPESRGMCSIKSNDNTIIHLAYSTAPINNGSASHSGLVVVLRDVTEQLKFEEQLRHSQKMDSIGQLAGGIAHDFNNMLCCILGSASLIARRLGQNHHLHQGVQNIIDAANRAAELTRKLLAFSRKEKPIKKPVNINPLISDTISMLSRSLPKNITLSFDHQADNDCVSADTSMIQNMIINLCINARDAMPDGGLIRLSSANTFFSESHCSRSAFEITSGEYLEIAVADNGVGMDKNTLAKIFDPFFTTKEVGKGTGLGLSIVYAAVKDLHGEIHVYSEPNVGSVFKIFLPLSKSGPDSAASSDGQPVPGQGTILIVDDEDMIRELLADILQECGYQTIPAVNGLDAVQTYSARQQDIDLVILDIIMPVMDGAKTFDNLVNINPKVRILFSSGFARDKDSLPFDSPSCVGFIQKPYDPVLLSQMVADAITKSH